MVVAQPRNEERQCVRVDMLDSQACLLSSRFAIGGPTAEPTSSELSPFTQLLPIIFRLLFSRPKRDDTQPHQNTRSQNDDYPSSAHRTSVSGFERNENFFVLIQSNSDGVIRENRVSLFQSKIEIQKSKIHIRSSLDRAAGDNNDRTFTETLMSGNSASNSPAMKKRIFMGVAIAAVVLIGVVVILFVPAREPVSMTFLEYHQSFHDAKLKLTNGSRKTITYLTDRDDDPVLCRLKTSAGWTNSSRELVRGTMMDGLTGKTTPFYIYADPGFMTNLGPDNSKSLQPNDLKPGQSAELYVWLQADGSSIRAGTLCIVPQGKLAEQIGHWLNRVKRWCRMKTTPPGVVEVWCRQPLQDPSSLRPGTNWYDL